MTQGELRVLFIAYYFPPMAMSGVQRVSKFAKYLTEHNWSPSILTAEPAGYFAFDDQLLEEITERQIPIYRTDSKDPTRLFGRRKKEVTPPKESIRKVASFASQATLIPDNKIGWKKYALEEGTRILKEQPFDAIFASAPPYTSLLIGMELSKRFGLPLVSDFRDDWLDNPRHIYPTPVHRSKHRKLEESVIAASSRVTTINRFIKQKLIDRHFGADGFRKIEIIPQGFDPDDFLYQPQAEPPSSRFRLTYTGLFYHAQKPDTFLRGLADLKVRRPDITEHIEAVFVGTFSDEARSLVEQLGLASEVIERGYLSHKETINEQLSTDVLWMTVGKQKGQELISTGKLHEYFGSRKPILGLVPEGAAQVALERYKAGMVVDPDDVDGVSRAIELLYDRRKEGTLPSPDESFIQSHNRNELAGVLSEVLKSTLRVQ